MTSSINSMTSRERSFGTCRAIWIMWQGREYGPFASESEARKAGFQFEPGQPLVNPPGNHWLIRLTPTKLP